MNTKKEKYIALKAEMFEFNTWINTSNSSHLKSMFTTILNDCNFTVINFTEHYFPVQGYTAVWLLAESHLAMHTFPNKEKTYIQISSCNEDKLMKLKNIINNKQAT